MFFILCMMDPVTNLVYFMALANHVVLPKCISVKSNNTIIQDITVQIFASLQNALTVILS
jgi:hypothetical protein